MPISREQLAGFPKWSGGRDNLQIVDSFKIAWADIDDLYAELFPAAAGGFPSPPENYGTSTVLYADSMEAEPFIGEDDVPTCSSGLQTYTYARVTVTYKTIPYEQATASDDAPDGQLITRNWVVSGEVLTLPTAGLQWNHLPNDNIVPPDVVCGIVCPMVDITVTLHRVTAAYFATLLSDIFDNVGKINNAAFEGAVAHTLLLLGADFTQTVSSDGAFTYECAIKFQYKNRQSDDIVGDDQINGWNIFFDPNRGQWRHLERANGEQIYEEFDFTTLYS